MIVNFLRLKNVPIFEQLQIEEALLRADEQSWFILNEGTPRALVMGISGKPDELINFKKMDAAPIPLIKRFSGGGTVVVDKNTLFATFIFQKELHPFPPFPEHILKWTAAFYKEALALNDFALKENDYVLKEKKCAGNAQYIRKGRWLHHTTFLWDYKKEHMEYLLMPKKQPAYRAQRSHLDFLTPLHEHLPSKEAFFTRCKEALEQNFSVQEKTLLDVKHMIQGSTHRKTTLEIHSINTNSSSPFFSINLTAKK